jgi:hypothetical protein
VWKERLWGRGRDIDLLERLRRWPQLADLAGDPKDNKLWVKGRGFQPFPEKHRKENPTGYGRQVSPTWSPDTPFIEARSDDLRLILTRSSFNAIGDRYRKLHRPRSQQIFTPPLVLINQGFTQFAY